MQPGPGQDQVPSPWETRTQTQSAASGHPYTDRSECTVWLWIFSLILPNFSWDTELGHRSREQATHPLPTHTSLLSPKEEGYDISEKVKWELPASTLRCYEGNHSLK